MRLSKDTLLKIMHNDDFPHSPTPPDGLTQEQLFYWKLKYDFPWYAESFLKIRNKHSELVPLKLNDAQLILERIDRYCTDNGIMRRYIILKARQMGMSTYTEGKIFHETVNSELTRSLILAHEEKASNNLFNMSKLFYEELPDIITPMKKYNNGKILAFENASNDEKEKKAVPGLRSNITIATAGTGEVGRSATPTKLHVSEVAFFPDAKTTMLGLLQGVPDTLDTLVILESTANGVGDWFHETWLKAERGENDFVPIFLPWFTDKLYKRNFFTEEERQAFIDRVDLVHTDSNGKEVFTYEYEIMQKYNLTYEQLNWRDWAIKNKCGGDEVLFMQEYPSTPEEAFISTGRPRFNIKALRAYQAISKKPIMRGYLREDSLGQISFIEDDFGYISIWEKPQHGKFYCAGADVAEGLSHGDFSCCLIGDPDTFNVVAVWHGHIDPDLFGYEISKLGRYYNQAYVGVEANNHGLTTLNSLKKHEYWELFFQKKYDRISNEMTKKLGWYTDSRSKPFMIDKLAEYVRENYLGIYSDLIIGELFTYVIDDKGSTNAQPGCYDDTVMALGILLQVMLEGKGEDFIPENPLEKSGAREVIDPLFESESQDEDISENRIEHEFSI